MMTQDEFIAALNTLRSSVLKPLIGLDIPDDEYDEIVEAFDEFIRTINEAQNELDT